MKVGIIKGTPKKKINPLLTSYKGLSISNCTMLKKKQIFILIKLNKKQIRTLTSKDFVNNRNVDINGSPTTLLANIK